MRTKLVFLTGATDAPFDLSGTGDPRSYADLTTPAGLGELAMTVNGFGPDKNQVIGRGAAGNLASETTLVREAHAGGAPARACIPALRLPHR
jgi:glycerophosphoryl diester phosphodiesterase